MAEEKYIMPEILYITLNESVSQISKNNKPISRLAITTALKNFNIWEQRPKTVN